MSSSPVKPREWEKSLTVKCRLCGGAKCKRCSESAALAKTDSPIHGLHADWVADRMLGMMRPSSRLMKDYQIAQQFHKMRIAAVFNLTLPGEHPYCGDGLVTSGFPYDPEMDLMAEKIRFYNFGWEDMTTPTLPFMLDIAKVMASVLQDGHSKLAVHCHAGYGRTGLAIACCLIFMHNIPPDRAIQIVRRDRPGSIQTSAQSKFVRLFHEYINASKVVFALPLIHDRFSLDEMVEQQNRMVHGERCTGSRLALPRVLDFLCREVEKGADLNASVVTQAFIFHLLWQGHVHDGKRSVCDYTELQEKHGKAVWGESYSSEMAIAPLDPTTTAVPPPVPASLAPCLHYVSQEELYPIKVAFNVGEWNWPEALQLSQASVAHPPALLLDWLEHLAEPLLPMEIVAQVDASPDESTLAKWKPLNQLPSFVIRSLDRLVCCLRHLLKKAETAPTTNALSVRAAMALFHLNASTPIATLCKHSEFVQHLAREWQPPKRLELNFESLHKLGKSNSQRRLQPQTPHSKAESETSGVVATPPSSPKRVSPEPGGSLEPMIHPRLHTPAAEVVGSPKQKEASELSPLKQIHLETTVPHSPLAQPQRPPSVELPPVPREKDDKESEPSPVKMDSLVPRFTNFDVAKKDPELPLAGLHPPDREALLSPSPPATAAALPVEAEKDRSAVHNSAPLHHSAPPPLTRGSGSGGNVYTLPSVKGGDRYKNRQP